MAVELNIPAYADGYTASNTNCVDIPIAGACGHYDPENYYSYSFLYGAQLNWGEPRGWLTTRNRILDHLGLALRPQPIRDDSELVPRVRRSLDAGSPIVLLVKYGALFYCEYYAWGDFDHAILVGDYDVERGIVGIRDREVVREHIRSGLFRGDILQRLQITDDMLRDIWIRSDRMFEVENSIHRGHFYSIDRTRATRATSRTHLLGAWLESEPTRASAFAGFVRHFDEWCESQRWEDRGFEAVRRLYHRSLIAFFDGLLHESQSGAAGAGEIGLSEVREAFLAHRSDLLSKLHLHLVKKRGLGPERSEDWASEIDLRDAELLRQVAALPGNGTKTEAWPEAADALPRGASRGR